MSWKLGFVAAWLCSARRNPALTWKGPLLCTKDDFANLGGLTFWGWLEVQKSCAVWGKVQFNCWTVRNPSGGKAWELWGRNETSTSYSAHHQPCMVGNGSVKCWQMLWGVLTVWLVTYKCHCSFSQLEEYMAHAGTCILICQFTGTGNCH